MLLHDVCMGATHWVVLRSALIMRQAANWADEDPVYDEFGNAYNDVAEGTAAKAKPGAALLPGLLCMRHTATQRNSAPAAAVTYVASAGHRPNPPPCSGCRQPM